MLTCLTKSRSVSSFSLPFFWSTQCTQFLLFFTSIPFQCPFVLDDSIICFADRGEGEQDWYVPRDFCNFLLFNFFFFGRHFFTHDIYPHPHPRPLPTTHDSRHLATLRQSQPFPEQIYNQNGSQGRLRAPTVGRANHNDEMTLLLYFLKKQEIRC